MAEEIQKKKISELPSAVYLSDEDVMPVVQGSGSSEATKKVDIGLVGSTVAESKTFSNLDTTSKTLVGAINEVNSSLGNVPSADEISYDNTSSGLSASDVQGAIDEIAQGGSGGSTVTVTQVQTTGTKIATITVDSVGTDLYAPNGGGSGHTILNDEGTSLTQRDDLQFKGAYSEDDSTNEKTVVNVVREMPKAEFDLLTEAEKTGLINITDITSGNDDRFQPVVYSEEEREIGVWIDGKPLYQKTFVIAGTNLTAGSSNVINHGISDVDYIQLVNGTYTFGDGEAKLPLPFADNYKPVTNSAVVIESINSTSIRIGIGNNYSGSVSPNTLWVTVQYTKTTDTAGSGTWTPQGVPTVHYSTDEKVVGTWIDGSTVYERTIEYSHTTQGAQTVSLPTGVVWSNIKNIVAIVKNETDVQSTYIFDATNRFSVRANSTDGIIVTMGSSYPAVPATVTITIHYTKSST